MRASGPRSPDHYRSFMAASIMRIIALRGSNRVIIWHDRAIQQDRV